MSKYSSNWSNVRIQTCKVQQEGIAAKWKNNLERDKLINMLNREKIVNMIKLCGDFFFPEMKIRTYELREKISYKVGSRLVGGIFFFGKFSTFL